MPLFLTMHTRIVASGQSIGLDEPQQPFLQPFGIAQGREHEAIRASRFIRAQCRSNANSTPWVTRNVVKTPQPIRTPT